MDEHPWFDYKLRGWVYKTARANLWRVPSWYTLDDLIHDGYLCFMACHRRYGTANRQQLIALARVAYGNHIATLARSKRLGEDVLFSDAAPKDEVGFAETKLPATPELGTLWSLLASAPKEVVGVLEIALSLDADVYQRTRWRREPTSRGAVRLRRRRRKLRETTNEHFCRLLGLDPDAVDLISMCRDHFSVT